MVTGYAIIISDGASSGMVVNKGRRKLLHIEGSRRRRLRRGQVFGGCYIGAVGGRLDTLREELAAEAALAATNGEEVGRRNEMSEQESGRGMELVTSDEVHRAGDVDTAKALEASSLLFKA